MSHAIDVTDADFAAKVLASPRPVVVDFWADWCAPCKKLSPILDELAETFDGQIDFVKIDTNENMGVPAQYGVLRLPPSSSSPAVRSSSSSRVPCRSFNCARRSKRSRSSPHDRGRSDSAWIGSSRSGWSLCAPELGSST